MNRITTLCLLALAATVGARAQALTTIRIGTSVEGPTFYVDGTSYSHSQVFTWPVGSVHFVEWRNSVDPQGQSAGYQQPDTNDRRYFFLGWLSNNALQNTSGASVSITAQTSTTSLIAQIGVTYRLDLEFFGTSGPIGTCGDTPQDPSIDGFHPGFIMFNNACFNDTVSIWQAAGPVNLTAFAYPGFAFADYIINGGYVFTPFSSYNVTGPTVFIVVFNPAKRVHFVTNPPGLKVLVDGNLIQTPNPIPDPLSGTCTPDFGRVSGGAPPGYTPLCQGDFDFLLGSKHTIGAPVSQMDSSATNWIFEGFTNGMGQNAVYTTDLVSNYSDTLTATFAPGVIVSLTTIPGGLPLTVDGKSYPGGYNFRWGAGETHQVTAPAQSTDSNGRKWLFSSWSGNTTTPGVATQTVTVPAATLGAFVSLTASYMELGQVQVTSVPPGLTFTIDGNNCVTPCSVDGVAGTNTQIKVPSQTGLAGSSRFDLAAWNDGSTATTRTVTFTQVLQSFSVNYHASYMLTTSSNPPNGATFTVSPSSADGFYADGTVVQVNLTTKSGYKFRAWDGDLSGTARPGFLTMSAPHSVIAVLDTALAQDITSIQNAAGQTPDGAVAPGSLITIFGDNLAQSTVTGPANPLSQSLANVTVTLGDQLLPLLYVSPTQINAQLVSNLGNGLANVTVHSTTQPDITGTLLVSRDAPAFFTSPNPQNQPLVVALHKDGTLVTFASPALRNETIQLFGTGFGPYTPTLPDGFEPPPGVTYQVNDPVVLTVGTLQVQPASTAPSPNAVGVTLIGLTITDSIPKATTVNLSVSVNGRKSPTVVLPVQ